MNNAQQYEAIHTELQHFREKIFGNGEPGLLSDVRLQGERLTRVESSSADNNARLVRIERALYASMGGMFVLQLFLKYLK